MCSRLKFRDPLPLTPLTDLNCMEDPCERVHVGETVWNFVLVIGLLDCGTMDTLIAFALMVGNAMMQALFCIAIMSPEFRGTAFASQLAVAKKSSAWVWATTRLTWTAHLPALLLGYAEVMKH